MTKSKAHKTTGKRSPFDTPGIQIRNPLSMGTIDMVTSKERSVTQITTMEEKEEERMPGFDINKFMGRQTRTNKKTEKKFVAPVIKKKPLWYRILQTVASVLLLLFPKDKLDKSNYKK